MDDFLQIFESDFAPKLNHREEGFRTIFKALSFHTDLIIIETGCLRLLDNWSGDGQSTIMFEQLHNFSEGQFFSIDSNPESIATAKRVCKNTHFLLGTGVEQINSLIRQDDLGRIDLLYLDSFDHGRDTSTIPAPVHYLLELAAAWPALSTNSIIAIDDFRSDPEPTKGLGVEIFLSAIGAEVLYAGYQKVWRL